MDTPKGQQFQKDNDTVHRREGPGEDDVTFQPQWGLLGVTGNGIHLLATLRSHLVFSDLIASSSFFSSV